MFLSIIIIANEVNINIFFELNMAATQKCCFIDFYLKEEEPGNLWDKVKCFHVKFPDSARFTQKQIPDIIEPQMKEYSKQE